MANLNICDLPDNILERIFRKVDSGALKKLTEVCPRFNNVIGSNRKLMDRFPRVMWSSYHCWSKEVQPMLMSERKYRRMTIHGVKALEPNLKLFLKKHATTLTTVRFSDCSFKGSELRSALLALAQNVSKISMSNVKFEVYKKKRKVAPIRFKQLNTLDIDGYYDSSVFGFFAGVTTVVRLQLATYCMEAEMFSPFVLGSEGLKTLQISAQLLGSTLFSDFNAYRFQLTTLDVYILESDDSDEEDDEVEYERTSQHFWNFVDAQRSTLKELHLTQFEIDRVDILLSLKLRKLFLTRCRLTQDSNQLEENVSITALQLYDIRYENEILFYSMIEKCTGLKRITLFRMADNPEMALAIHQSNVKTLILDEPCIPVSIPSLRTLIVKYITNRLLTDMIRFIRLNPQLKILTVPARLSRKPAFVRAIETMNLKSLNYK